MVPGTVRAGGTPPGPQRAAAREESDLEAGRLEVGLSEAEESAARDADVAREGDHRCD